MPDTLTGLGCKRQDRPIARFVRSKTVSRHCGRILEFSALRLRAIDVPNSKLYFIVTEQLCAQWPAYRCLSIDYMFIDTLAVCTIFLW